MALRVNLFDLSIAANRLVYKYSMAYSNAKGEVATHDLTTRDSKYAIRDACKILSSKTGGDARTIFDSLLFDYPQSDEVPILVIYSSVEYQDVEGEFEVKRKTYKYSFKRARQDGEVRGSLDPDKPEYVQFLKVLFSSYLEAQDSDYIRIKRGYYTLPEGALTTDVSAQHFITTHTDRDTRISYAWFRGFSCTPVLSAVGKGVNRLCLQIIPTTARVQRRTLRDLYDEDPDMFQGRSGPKGATTWGVKGYSVMTLHNGIMYKVRKVVTGAGARGFTERDGKGGTSKEVTYEAYFRNTYGNKLTDLYSSVCNTKDIYEKIKTDKCAVICVRKSKTTGNIREAVLPISLCVIAQDYERVSFNIKQEVIATTQSAPEPLISMATSLAKSLGSKIGSLAKNWDIKLADVPIEVPMKSCRHPRIHISPRDPMVLQSPEKIRELTKGLKSCADLPQIRDDKGGKNGISNWMVVGFSEDHVAALSKKMRDNFTQICGQSCPVSAPFTYVIDKRGVNFRNQTDVARKYCIGVRDALERCGFGKTLEESARKTSIIFAIIPGPKGKTEVYPMLKQLMVGARIVTQCIIEPKPQQGGGRGGRQGGGDQLPWKPDVIYGLTCQAFAKLGGLVWRPEVSKLFGDTMLLSYDVSRGMFTKEGDSGKQDEPTLDSLKAVDRYRVRHLDTDRNVVASYLSTYSPNLFKFYSQWRETPKTASNYAGEIAGEDTVRETFKSSLQIYHNNNKKLPSRIVYLRDGVGAGQIDAVRRQELDVMLRGIQAAYGKAKQRLDFWYIVCEKNSDLRWAKSGSQDGHAQPGTYVLDGRRMYIASQHLTNKRTSAKPMEYHVVYRGVFDGENMEEKDVSFTDESTLSVEGISEMRMSDFVEMLNALTYGYQNWPSSIAAPAILHCSHLLSKFAQEVLGGVTQVGQDKSNPNFQFLPFYI
ncbi:Argonaute [Giardia muris]|uniref:Argonaute n=1 Tax=Giardia muris TaxID=5742 RepID=A0A4Z1SUE8_GIAMU|nr:Argonaute [Giardia muris]|eukprot:TNJ28595.1 Argonaute [Giardia muris]